MSAVRPWSADAEPFASPDRPGSEPRGVREGADLGLVMTLPWTGRLPSGRRHARASLAPRDHCVSAASGGLLCVGHAPALVLLLGPVVGCSDPAMTPLGSRPPPMLDADQPHLA